MILSTCIYTYTYQGTQWISFVEFLITKLESVIQTNICRACHIALTNQKNPHSIYGVVFAICSDYQLVTEVRTADFKQQIIGYLDTY